MTPLSTNNLVNWILFNSDNVTQLKLQKLLFYSYGAALAFDLEAEIHPLSFEAWQYGPVDPNVYNELKHYKAQILPKPINAPIFSSNLEYILRLILKIYGKLSARDLVTQSHFEKPWIEAWSQEGKQIDSFQLKPFFKNKFKENEISYPEVIFDTGFLTIDNLFIKKFKNLEELSESLN